MRILVLAGITGVLAWGISRALIGSGRAPLPIPWTVLVVVVVAAVVAVVLGWAVRQYRRGKRPGLSPIRAARTAVYAQACAYAGAILGGAYGGYAVALAADWGHAPRRAVAVSALIGLVGAAVLCGAGLLAEHWCKHDGDAAAPV